AFDLKPEVASFEVGHCSLPIHREGRTPQGFGIGAGTASGDQDPGFGSDHKVFYLALFPMAADIDGLTRFKQAGDVGGKPQMDPSAQAEGTAGGGDVPVLLVGRG
ncbi:MAG TPA: hypothetical protein QGG37_01840, partial [Chloroflexota bacterium]|nr:hypothetical protein [Chloroflexota bacterium]